MADHPVIRSMTGYGAGEEALADGTSITVEIRTVNHRHLNVRVRLPRGWQRLEEGVVDLVRSALARGSVSVAVGCEGGGVEEPAPVLDLDRARHYAELMRALSRELAFGEGDCRAMVSLDALMRLPGVLAVSEPAAPAVDEDALGRCVETALGGVVAMREAEGGRLESALRRSLREIGEAVAAIEAAAPARLLRERDRLRARVAILAERPEVDEERLAREIAYLAERWDIAEEIVRIRSHMALFADTMGADRETGEAGGAARVGKRLGFVVQEMNREANTIAAKANDAAISAAAVVVKEKLEVVREQLENVE